MTIRKIGSNMKIIACSFMIIILIIHTIYWFELNNQPEPIFNLNCPEQVCNTVCPEIPELVCNTQCSTCPEKLLFVKEAENVAEAHDWEEMRYMCCDFSVELFERLKADGYSDVKICEGIALWCNPKEDNFDCKHCWIKIGESIVIETITGEIIPPKDYHKNYDEKRCYSHIPLHIRNWINSYWG